MGVSDGYGGSGASTGSVDKRAVTVAWQAWILIGLITLALGIVVTIHPTTSLNVIAVLLGILLLISGVLQLIRALDTSVAHRAWAAIVGLAFVILGVVLIRHLHLTLVLIALLVGITWIAQGVIELMVAFTEKNRVGRGWSFFFGIVSLAAGIVVIAVPEGSLKVLAVLLGIWFIVLGVLDIIGGFVMRHIAKEASAS
jgi:uncharacterized membrane protein HdeD (DUF308 family)